MWAAVTIRTRWAADLRRRIMLVMWIAIALGGLACFVAGVVATIRHGEIPTMVWILIGATVTLLIVAAMLALRWSSAAGVIGVIGLGAFAVGAASAALAGAVPWVAWILILAALVLPVLSAALWGTQWRASLIAAAAGTFVIPAAFFALVGLGTYNAFEKLAPGGTRTTNPS